MYCKYCGRKLEENETCNCQNATGSSEGSSSEREETSGGQAGNDRAGSGASDGQSGQNGQTGSQWQQYSDERAQRARDASRGSWALIPELLKDQSATLNRLVGEENKDPQMFLGGIYLALWFIFGLVLALRMQLGAVSIGYGLLFAFFAAACKAILAYGSYLLSDKQHSVKSIVCLFCACSIQESIGVALLIIFSLFGVMNTYVVLILVLLMVIAAGAVSNYNAERIICPEGKAQLLLYVVTAVMTLIIILVVQQMPVAAVLNLFFGR